MTFSVSILLAAEAVFALWLLYRSGNLKSPRSFYLSLVLLAAAFILRAALFNYETLDYQNFLTHWVDYYRSNGGFKALARSNGNYNIPYLYFMALFSYSGIRDLYLIKLLSCFFDVVLAFSVMQLTARMTLVPAKRLAAFFAVLFLPTVVLNGALWGQCDSIYVSLALLGVVLALEDRPVLSMMCMAASFGFKLQAVFLLPVCAVLWMYGKYEIKHFFVFPLTYLVMVLPAVLLGRPFSDAIMLYFDQAGTVGSGLNYNSPSVFAFFWRLSESEGAIAARYGIAAAFALMLAVLVLCFVKRKNLNDRAVIFSLLVFVIGIPFLLPHMHDRYFFAADVVSVAVAAFLPELVLFIAVPVEFASFLGYYAYLHMRYLLYVDHGARALIIALVSSIFGLILSFSKKIKKFEKSA